MPTHEYNVELRDGSIHRLLSQTDPDRHTSMHLFEHLAEVLAQEIEGDLTDIVRFTYVGDGAIDRGRTKR